jgi:hypothetical protein
MDLSKNAAKRSGHKKRRLYCRVLHFQPENLKSCLSSPLRPAIIARRRRPPGPPHPPAFAQFSVTSAKDSGDDRGRTGNLRLAKPALSQLSYVPEPHSLLVSRRSSLAPRPLRDTIHERRATKQMGPGRFELPTSPLSGVRSNQLSYEPYARCSLPPNSTPNRLNWLRMSVLYTSGVSKEQQKNRCFTLPAVPISRSRPFRDGSLKQELSGYQHSFQDSCLPFTIGVHTPHPILDLAFYVDIGCWSRFFSFFQ